MIKKLKVKKANHIRQFEKLKTIYESQTRVQFNLSTPSRSGKKNFEQNTAFSAPHVLEANCGQTV